MLLLPFHVDSTIRRFPRATLAIVGLTLLVGLLQWLVPVRINDAVVGEMLTHYVEHPYLDTPELLKQVLPPSELEQLERVSAQRRSFGGTPDAAVVAAEQQELNRLEAAVFAERDRLPAYRFGFREGNLLGIFSYMLLHGGFWHFFGNMTLVYVMGLKLEDIWGARVLVLLYVTGGIVAALGHGLVDGLDVPIIGASGALAALMGAFLVRLTRVRIGFLLLTIVNIRNPWPIMVPAFVFLPLWFGKEVLTAATDSGGNVATWAHLFGFAFGALFALAVRSIGVEKQLLLPEQQREETKGIAHLENAQERLSLGHAAQALREVQQFLAANPDDTEGLMVLAQAQERAGLDPTPTAKRLCQYAWKQGDRETAARAQQRFDLPVNLDSAVRLHPYLSDEHAERLLQRLVAKRPDDPAAPKAALILATQHPSPVSFDLVTRVYQQTNDLDWQQTLAPYVST